jgi:uncharacterized protein (TIGR00369 family)
MAIELKFDPHNNPCFGCGPNNPIGLKLKFRQEHGKAKAEFVPGEHHQGWPGLIHGGVICALLDEAMGYVTFNMGLKTLTAKMELRFRQPVRIGQKLILTAKILDHRRNLIRTTGKIELEDGTTIAESTAIMFEIKDEKGNRSSHSGKAITCINPEK